MRFYEVVLEQLDLAAELLQERHPMQSRLALILIDNAVEYSLHRYTTDYFKLHTIPGSLPVPERRKLYRKRAHASGRYIGPKIAFARRQSAVTEDQAVFVRHAHEFRNEAYHAGIAHDAIITQLATTYFSVFCEMLPKLAPRWMRFRFDQALSNRVARHLAREAGTPMPDAEAIAASLMRVLPPLAAGLPGVCRESLADQLSDIRATIAYIIRNDSTVSGADSLILETQFWNAFWSAAPVEGLTVRVDDGGVAEVHPAQKAEWEEALSQMRATWSPKVSLRTLGRWEQRIAALPQEKKQGILLQKYQHLKSDMQPLSQMLSERCGQLDQHIDELIERRALGR